MRHERLINELEHFGAVLPVVVAGLEDDDARWRGPGAAWSILEIVSHLADEEVEDFRTRLRLTLEAPQEPWPPIDPEGAATERRYNDGELGAVTARFVTERRESITWLRGLASPDWSLRYTHPTLGGFRAGDILAAWTAHDALHLRQIAKRRFQMIERDAEEYGTAYAGSW